MFQIPGMDETYLSGRLKTWLYFHPIYGERMEFLRPYFFNLVLNNRDLRSTSENKALTMVDDGGKVLAREKKHLT